MKRAIAAILLFINLPKGIGFTYQSINTTALCVARCISPTKFNKSHESI